MEHNKAESPLMALSQKMTCANCTFTASKLIQNYSPPETSLCCSACLP